MSTCVNDLYDYDLFKKCRVCRKFSIKVSFHLKKAKKDGYRSDFKFCCEK